MNSKVLIGGITGGIAFFFLGWLVYGVLLFNFAETSYNQCMAKSMEEFSWIALALSNLTWGFFLAILFDWTKTSGLVDGLTKGAIIGFFTSLAYGLSFYAMQNMYLTKTAAIVDVVVGTAFVAVVGGIIAFVMDKSAKSS